jgi:hypothetical protein
MNYSMDYKIHNRFLGSDSFRATNVRKMRSTMILTKLREFTYLTNYYLVRIVYHRMSIIVAFLWDWR